MSVIDKIKLDGTTYDVGKTPDTTLAVSGSPADAAKVGTELSKKVDKVTGKGLSTNDFTTPEKTKLAGIAEKATAVAIDATLTQNEQAADAKVVGNKLATTEEALSTKAEIDGFYESMTVGNAEQLISSRYTVDTEPYLYRTSGGTADIGDREYDEIVGGSVVWNQLAQFSADVIPTDRSGISFTSDDNKSVTINSNGENTSTVDVNGWFGLSEAIGLKEIAGHVLMLSAKLISGTVNNGNIWIVSTTNIGFVNTKAVQPGTSQIVKAPNDISGQRRIILRIPPSIVLNNLKITFNLFDLTQMFGSEIADYVYNLEQTTRGAGVAWFRKYFPKDYYDYNAGELKHVEGLTSHNMVGFNQWDEEWELGSISIITGANIGGSDNIRAKNFCPMLPNTTYCFKNPSGGGTSSVFFYDSDKKYLGYVSMGTSAYLVFTSMEKTAYFRFAMASAYGTTYKNDININLSWSGWRNGEYEPYAKHSYPLDPSLTLRGILKLSADGKLYFDGDMYASDGTVTRRYALVDMGTLNWSLSSKYFQSGTLANKIKPPKNNSVPVNIIADEYTTIAWSASADTDKLIAANVSGVISCVNSAYTDVESFKAAMSGVWLLYELAEPTTETALPYQSPQIVDDFGTEEYVSTGIVPVGHETKYLANLRDKIQHLPDLADSDGYYVIQQTGHDMSLVHFRIPQAPTTDGTYTLKATVTGGVPTYTWEGVTDNEG